MAADEFGPGSRMMAEVSLISLLGRFAFVAVVGRLSGHQYFAANPRFP